MGKSKEWGHEGIEEWGRESREWGRVFLFDFGVTRQFHAYSPNINVNADRHAVAQRPVTFALGEAQRIKGATH